MLNFVKCFVCIYWGDHMIFILHFVMLNYIDCCLNLKQAYILGINPFGCNVEFLLCIAEFDLSIFCWEFCSYIPERYWSVIFLCVLSFFGFGIRVMMASYNGLGSIFGKDALLFFGKDCFRVSFISSLNVW